MNIITTEERNKIKTKIQDEIAELSVIHPFLCIEISTGGGKGLSLIKCIDKSNSKKKWLICVPEIQQISNLEKEFIKFGYENLLSEKIEAIICYDSLHKYEGRSLNIAANECQHISENRHEIFKTIDYQQFIADSATVPERIKYQLEEIGDFYTYHLPLKEGIKLGIFQAPKIYLIPIRLQSTKEKFEYKKYGKTVKGTAEEYYNYLGTQIKYWRDRYNKEGADYQQNKSLQTASTRKRFLASLKTVIAKEYVKKFEKENRRFIIFNGSIPQTEEILGKKYAVHSKKSKKQNTEIIDKFNSLEYDRIATCSMLTEGMNLEQLDTVGIVQLDSGEYNGSLRAIQQMGRMRFEPQLYIFFVEGTKDVDYVNNAVNAIGREFVVNNKN